MTTIFETNFELGDIDLVAKQVLELLPSHMGTIALSGQLGAGKTTLTAALAHQLGSLDPISSPTFSIINEYVAQEMLIYHSDWYRLNDIEEAIAAGVEDMMQTKSLKIIEWWEKAPELLPDDTLFLFLEVESPTERQLTIKKL